MPTSNSKPQVNPATDSPLGAPAGNEPYQTVRAKNWAQDHQEDNGTPGNSAHETTRAGNRAFFQKHDTPQPKPTQGA